MKDNRSYVFYFPYKLIGGVSNLFLKCFHILNSNYQDVYLVDFKDGYMAKNQQDKFKDKLIDVEKLKKFNNKSTFIFQSIAPWNIKNYKSFNNEDNVLFWNLHPYNLFPYLLTDRDSFFKKYISRLIKPFAYFRKKKIRNFVKLMIENKSIYFMDDENKRKTEEFLELKISDEFILPLFVDQSNLRISSKEINTISKIGYLGRLVDFKVFPLIQILNRFEKLEKGYQFYIIGNGPMEDQLKKITKNFKFLKVIFHDEIDIKNNDSILYDIDLFFSMGLSLVEIASRGIPVIPMDYSYKNVDDLIKLNYLRDIENFNLAEELLNVNQFEEICTLKKRITDLELNYSAYCKESKDWAEKYFSASNWTNKFLKIMSKSTMKIKDIRKNNFHKPDLISYVFKSLVISFKKNETSYFNNL